MVFRKFDALSLTRFAVKKNTIVTNQPQSPEIYTNNGSSLISSLNNQPIKVSYPDRKLFTQN
jgi:hypothetical protein